MCSFGTYRRWPELGHHGFSLIRKNVLRETQRVLRKQDFLFIKKPLLKRYYARVIDFVYNERREKIYYGSFTCLSRFATLVPVRCTGYPLAAILVLPRLRRLVRVVASPLGELLLHFFF